MMKILHITRSLADSPKYGIPKSLGPLIAGLREKGHAVELLDQGIIEKMPLKPWESWLIKKYLDHLKFKFGDEGKSAWYVMHERVEIGIRAAKIAKQQNITHVHCHDALIGFMYDFFRKIYRSTPCWGITEHAFGRFVKLRGGVITSEKSLKALQKHELSATVKAKWIVFPSERGMNQFLKDMQLAAPSKTWYVVPHVVNVEMFDRKSARQKLGIADDEKLLLAVGSLIRMKRFELLLNSVAQIPKHLLKKIIILGDGPEKENLAQLAKTLNLRQQIEFTTTNDVGEYLSAADIYVSTSGTESYGLANCEALLAGVPLVVTAVDAVPEIVGDAALLVNDDPGNIAKTIESVLVSKELQNTLKQKAGSLTAKWPDQQWLAEKMIEIYTCC
jgi:glycosyltransferase involved in cell wall biosynthesis